jgi:hypothetical protein
MSQGPQREGGTRQDTVRVTERKRLSEGHSRIGEKKKVEKSNLQTYRESGCQIGVAPYVPCGLIVDPSIITIAEELS